MTQTNETQTPAPAGLSQGWYALFDGEHAHPLLDGVYTLAQVDEISRASNNQSAEIARLTAELETMTEMREASRRCHLDLRSERHELLGQLEVMTNKHTGRVKDVERLTAERDAETERADATARALFDASAEVKRLRAEEN